MFEIFVDEEKDDVPRSHPTKGRHEAAIQGHEAFVAQGGGEALGGRPIDVDLAAGPGGLGRGRRGGGRFGRVSGEGLAQPSLIHHTRSDNITGTERLKNKRKYRVN